MGETQPAPSTTDHGGGGEAHYTALQRRLAAFADDVTRLQALLADLHKHIAANADHASDISRRAAESDYDSKPVELAKAVSIALGGTSNDARTLTEMAGKIATKAENARATHQRLYERLHTVRSQRTERTPKPGAFTRPN